MSRSASPVRALRARLGRLRSRIRALFAVQGLARLLTAAVIALVLFFVADWLLDLPLGVRRFVRLGLLDRPEGLAVASWLLLLLASAWLTFFSTRRDLGAAPVFAFAFAGIGGVLAWLGLKLFRPVTVRLPDEELALAVEHEYRRLNDRLAAALDFERELAHPTRGESAAMMRVVLDEASEQAQGLAFARAVSGRRALRWAGVALGAVGAAVLVAVAWPQTVGLWARRSLLLEEMQWPKATHVLAVDVLEDGGTVDHDPARAYEVAVGRPLLVVAEARGRVPDEVLLVDRVEGARTLPRRMFPVPDHEGRFQIEIRDVRRPFAFVLRGGDDTDEEPLYRVEITVPPRVLALHAHLAFPDYLGRADEDVEGGDLGVPEGTRITITLQADVPIAKARAVLPGQVIDAEAVGDDGRTFRFGFTAEETGRYRVQLRTPEGRESDPAADTYEVRVAPDRAPHVRWLYPRTTAETTPNGRVPLLAEATDDHGVSRLDLEVTMDGKPVGTWLLRPWAEATDGDTGGDPESRPGTDGPYGRPEVRVYVPLEIASLADESGRAPVSSTHLSARLVVTDSKGQRTEGPSEPIDIDGPADRQRTLAERRTTVRSQIAAVLEEQRNRRRQIADLVGVPLGDAERDLLKSVQFAQAKIAQDLDQAVRELTDIFNGWVYDRLGAENPTERILALLDRYHRTTFGREPGEPEGGAQGRGLALGEPVFPYALYDEILRAWHDRTIYDTGLIDRMLVVLDGAVDAVARRAPAAHEAAVRVVAGEADLQQLLAAQDASIAKLEEVIDAMRSWQSLNDVIFLLRSILEKQEALNERLDQAK